MTETNFKVFLVNRVSQLVALAILAAILLLSPGVVSNPLVMKALLTAVLLLVASISGIKNPLALIALLLKHWGMS